MGNERDDTSVAQPPDPEDVRLVRQALSGSREAFNDLIDRHDSSVLRLLERMVGNAAEDLRQKVLLKAYDALEQYKPTHPFRGWILKIAYNAAIDFYRSRKQSSEVSAEELEEWQRDDTPLQDRVLEIKQLWSHSRELMLDWVERYLASDRHQNVRMAITMSLDGYHGDWSAIAEACDYRTKDAARNSVKTQIKKALASPEALRDACAIAHAIKVNCEVLGLAPGSILFLGLIDLNDIERSHEEDHCS